jgi:RND family efflux transporter MFP subunit
LENTRDKAQNDLEAAYNNALNTLRSSSESAKQTLVTLSEIQYNHFQDNTQTSLMIQSAKATAMKRLFGVSGAGNWTASYVNSTGGGLYEEISNLSAENFNKIDQLLNQMIQVLEATKQALNLVPLNKLSATEKSTLTTQKNTTNSQISAVSSATQGIENQKTANQSLINNAESGVVNAENAVESARSQLTSVKSEATNEQIAAQEAQVKSALANLYQVQAQLNKATIESPISGKVASLPITKGELVSPNQLVASIVNNNALEVKSYLNSEEASLVNRGDEARIEEEIDATVNRIAPGINPQSKKVEVQILIENPQSSDLTIGQFVNLEILTEESGASDFYLIPLSAVRNKANNGAVVLIVENGKVIEKSVELGDIKGEKVEILSGLEDDDEIIESARGLKAGQEVRVTS